MSRAAAVGALVYQKNYCDLVLIASEARSVLALDSTTDCLDRSHAMAALSLRSAAFTECNLICKAVLISRTSL